MALILGGGPLAYTADPTFDAKGFNPNREYFSQLPFEHVDPMTGNLLLTFTDLTLPGNAGFDLRIQRTYNSKIYDVYQSLGGFTLGEDSWAGFGWTLHLGRVLNARSLSPGPVIEMSDGSRHQAFLHLDGRANHFMTREYWTYDSGFGGPGTLRLPSGLTFTFAHSAFPRPGVEILYATKIEDPFGNQVLINYFPSPAPRTRSKASSSTWPTARLAPSPSRSTPRCPTPTVGRPQPGASAR